MAGTATPQIARLGIGTAAHANDALTIGTFSGFKSFNDNQGEEIHAFTGTDFPGPTGHRFHMSQGTAASPLTHEQPTLAVHTVRNVTSPTQNAASAQWHTAIAGSARGNSGDRTMVTGVMGAANQFSTAAVAEADACGVWGIGSHHGIGGGFGAYFEGRITSNATSGTPGVAARCRGIEVRIANYEATPDDNGYIADPYSDNVMNGIQISTVVANDSTKEGGTGLLLYRPSAASGFAQFDVGVACTATNDPVKHAFLRDDGDSEYSLLVNGTKSVAAIAVASGKVLFGATTSGIATTCEMRATAAGDNALRLTAHASQSSNILYVANSAGTEQFGISSAGNTRVLKQLQIEGTGGDGVLRFLEQGSNPAATTQDQRFNMYMKADKLVIQFNTGGTTRYFTLDLTQSAATPVWAQSTTGP